MNMLATYLCIKKCFWTLRNKQNYLKISLFCYTLQYCQKQWPSCIYKTIWRYSHMESEFVTKKKKYLLCKQEAVNPILEAPIFSEWSRYLCCLKLAPFCKSVYNLPCTAWCVCVPQLKNIWILLFRSFSEKVSNYTEILATTLIRTCTNTITIQLWTMWTMCASIWSKVCDAGQYYS